MNCLNYKSIILSILLILSLYLPAMAITKEQYMDIVQKKIQKNLESINYPYPFEVRYSYSILNNSKMYGVKIIKSSGNNNIDKLIIQKIWKAGPIPPFPKEFINAQPGLTGLVMTTTFQRTIVSKPVNSEPQKEIEVSNAEVDNSNNGQIEYNSDNTKLDQPNITIKIPDINQEITLNSTHENNSNGNLIDRVAKLENILGIKPESLSIIARLNSIDIALTGSVQNGSILERIQNIENTLNNSPKPASNTKEIKLAPIQGENNKLISPQSNNNNFLEDPFILKKPFNPMNWRYDPKVGSYLRTLYAHNSTKKSNKGLGFPKFQKFPIKYWIQPMNADMQQPVRTALTEFTYYFPMEEVSSKIRADLTIEVVDYLTIMQKCHQPVPHKTLACGGPQYKIESYYDLKAVTKYKAGVLIDANSFKIKNLYNTILHEIVHAFGVTVHSDNPEDAMFAIADLGYDREGKVNQTNASGKLTPRDLNTLFLLYNQE